MNTTDARSGLTTNRATQAEKADAWDHLMRSTEADSVAIQDAFTYLYDRIEAREDQGEDLGHYPS